MTETETSSDAQEALVDQAIEEFLAATDPKAMTDVEFRGARFDAGLGLVNFAVGEGGLGVRPSLQRKVESAMSAAGAAPMNPAMFFLFLAGPTITTHGSDEVKKNRLRPMFTGEEIWCQLFSEPGAGSDFAGLACKAERDGDEWVLNGQKVWNTLAHIGDRGMLVARTDPSKPKHKGMTYFALDMHAPGVEVRPLRQITGEAEFNEVYLTDVRVPDSDRIGDVGEGWRVSMTTLSNERTTIGGGSGGGGGAGSGIIGEAVRIWQSETVDRSGANKDKLMKAWVEAEVFRLNNQRAAANARAGNPGPEGSISKLHFADVNKMVTEICIDLLGPAGLVDYDYTFRRPESAAPSGGAGQSREMFLRVRANSIEGGTSEVLRNIIGERILGLPGEPRVDKDVPWIDVPRS